MDRRGLLLFLLGTVIGAGLARGQVSGAPDSGKASPRAPYTLSVQSRVVLTDVTVTDRQGNPVRGLTAGDFRILDSGRDQRIASFEEHVQPAQEMPVAAATEPGVFSNAYLAHPPSVVNVILIDATTIRIVDQMYLYEEMQHLVQALPAGEPVAVFSRRGDMTLLLQSFTADHALLLAALRRAIPHLQQPGAWMASDIDTLQQIAQYLSQVPGRKNVLWFSGGSNLYLNPDPTAGAGWVNWQPVYDLLESERIAIYPIDARGLIIASGFWFMNQQMRMRLTAEATGGQAYMNTNGLALAAGHILATDGDYYTLTYSPDDLRGNGRWHRVEVKVPEGRHYQLSYRRGYFDDGGSGQDREIPGQTMRTRLRADGSRMQVPNNRSEPIIFEAQVLPISAQADPTAGGGQPPKRGEAPYAVRYTVPAGEIYPESIQGNLGTDVVQSAIVAFDHNGGLITRAAQRVTLGVDESKARSLAHPVVRFDERVNLPRGQDYLLLAVWDTTTGRVGTMSVQVEVKKP